MATRRTKSRRKAETTAEAASKAGTKAPANSASRRSRSARASRSSRTASGSKTNPIRLPAVVAAAAPAPRRPLPGERAACAFVSKHGARARKARRQADRAIARQLKDFAALARSLRRALRTELRKAKVDLRALNRNTRQDLLIALENAAFSFRVGRRAFVAALGRKLRRSHDWLSRRADDRLAEAHLTMQRTFKPVLVRVAPYRRSALAGGTAALAVTLVSLGWLALFDYAATAVPTQEVARTADTVGLASSQDDSRAQPMSGNIDMPPVASQFSAPAATAPAAKAADVAPMTPVPPPAPIKHAAKPVKHERATRHQAKRHHRGHHYTATRAARESRAEATSDDMLPAIPGGHSLIAEARSYLGTNPTGRSNLWCAAFLDMVLRKTGHKGGGNLALGYEHYGTRVAGPEIGAIAVMARRGGGHVGVVSGVDPNGNPIIVSGNHNHTVAEAVYPRGRILTYVMPN